MATIDNVVKVEVVRQSNNVTVRDLETILFLTKHTRFTADEDYRIYESTTAMLEDGFLTTDAAYIAAQRVFSQDPRPSKVVVGVVKDGETYVQALVRQQGVYNKFLYVITDAATDAEKEAIADYVETQSRMFYVFSDSNAVTYTVATTDIFSKLKAKGYDRSFGIYTKDGVGNAMIEAAWVGRFSAEPIGSAIWIYKELDGIIADGYTATEEAYLQSKNANYYTTVEDESVVFGENKVVGGEFIDVLLGATWVEVRMGERIWGLIKAQNKINYTNAGISMIEIKIREVLDEAVAMQILTTDDPIRVVVPNANNIPSSTRNTRILSGITFEARLAGAIQKVDGIRGTVYA